MSWILFIVFSSVSSFVKITVRGSSFSYLNNTQHDTLSHKIYRHTNINQGRIQIISFFVVVLGRALWIQLKSLNSGTFLLHMKQWLPKQPKQHQLCKVTRKMQDSLVSWSLVRGKTPWIVKYQTEDQNKTINIDREMGGSTHMVSTRLHD